MRAHRLAPGPLTHEQDSHPTAVHPRRTAHVSLTAGDRPGRRQGRGAECRRLSLLMEGSVECLLLRPARRRWALHRPASPLLSPPRPTGPATRETEGPLPREENTFPAADLKPESLEEGRSRSQRLWCFLSETSNTVSKATKRRHTSRAPRASTPPPPEGQPACPPASGVPPTAG